jgi:hypothetical protein
MRIMKIGVVSAALVVSAACDYTGDWLFAGQVEGVPGVTHLGEIVPSDIASAVDIDAVAVYGEVGPTGTSDKGGVTFTFEGTGSHVCVWVDPELVFWNQSVAARRRTERYAYPDNVFDDGDLDLFAGLAAYYNGSPGEQLGDFEVRYEDSLGNPVTVALNECTIASLNASSGGHSGRGAPEYCTIFNTQPGVDYLVLMEAWSTPLDDDVLGYGLLVANGGCENIPGGGTPECVILGEGVEPHSSGSPGPWIGLDNVPSRAGSQGFEEIFCDSETSMADFCLTEAAQNNCTDPDEGCFCGNPEDTPSPGSF